MAIVAQVNGKELPGKPTITWFKGKWLELGIKSGARFSFKETHDSANNVRPLWALLLGRPVTMWGVVVGRSPTDRGRREGGAAW